MATLIQIRRGTDAEWTSANPILSAGELALSTDLGTIKVGNGSSNWSSLEYITPLTSDDLSEGSSNLYFTDTRAVSAVELTIASASAAALSAANSYSDSLDTDDVSEGLSNLYFTNQRALDATLASIISASAAAVGSANGYTDSQISSIIDSAPSTLDTLNELAAALNDDSNFATTITNSIGTKLSISDASATYLTKIDAANSYDTLGSSSAAQSAATGYTDSAINALDTDDIEEGSANLYFTNQRALDASISTIASASANAISYADNLTTSDISEGSGLYFTNQRALDANFSTISSASAAAVVSANEYTDTSINNLVDSAPGALNTLNELAAALGDDANFATTVTDILSTKLHVAAASSTYLSQVDASNTYLTQTYASATYATTINNILEITSNSTLSLSDVGKIIEINSSSAVTITIPNDENVFFLTGTEIRIVQTGPGSVSVVGASGVDLRSQLEDNDLEEVYSSATIYKRSPNEWVFIQSTSAIDQMYLRSANNTLYKIVVDNDGSLTTEQV
jgi:hypothetical protein